MIVYRFGCHVSKEHKSLVGSQILLAHRYRNRLCEIERNRRQASEKILNESCPRLLGLEKQLESIESEIVEIQSKAKKANAKNRKVLVMPKEQKQRIAELKKLRKPLYEERKQLRTDLFGVSARVAELKKAASDLHSKPDTAVPAMLAVLKKHGMEYPSLTKALNERSAAKSGEKRVADDNVRDELAKVVIAESNNPSVAQLLYVLDRVTHDILIQARKDNQLYWGTYLTVEAAANSFRSGAPPRFKRWDGCGKTAIQFPSGTTFDDLLDGNTRLSIDDSTNIRKGQADRKSVV